MALPISVTPTLKGEDSRKFNLMLDKVDSMRISKKKRAKGLAILKAVLKNSDF